GTYHVSLSLHDALPIYGRWTKRRKEEILLSRTRGTRLIAETLAALKRPPGVFLCASGIGTTREGGREVDEKDSAGSGFLSGVIRSEEHTSELQSRENLV